MVLGQCAGAIHLVLQAPGLVVKAVAVGAIGMPLRHFAPFGVIEKAFAGQQGADIVAAIIRRAIILHQIIFHVRDAPRPIVG